MFEAAEKKYGTLDKKQKRENEPFTRRVVGRVEDIRDDDDWQMTHNIQNFLDLPTDEGMKKCFHDFYVVTSWQSLEMCVCAVCGHEVGIQADRVLHMQVVDIPNGESLVPKHSHPLHSLFNGKLLDPCGVFRLADEEYVYLCGACWAELKGFGPKN